MSIDSPGFADPVAGAQSCFRAVLDAMARPGSRHAAGDALAPPAPLDPATAAVLLTLVDADSKLWLAPECRPAAEWLVFHCNADVVDDIGRADFVLATGLPDLATLATGSDEGPEESATLILQLGGLDGGMALRLAGPGLREPADLNVDGLPPDFVESWATNHALFPRGVDIIFCAGRELAALPRSVQIGKG